MKKVLLVEDDLDTRETIKYFLMLEGHEIYTAENGQEAIIYLKNCPPPDVIVLDIMMPIMNGLEFRKVQLATPTWANIPVIILTASINYKEHAEELSPYAFMPKPVDFDQLCVLVEQA